LVYLGGSIQSPLGSGQVTCEGTFFVVVSFIFGFHNGCDRTHVDPVQVN